MPTKKITFFRNGLGNFICFTPALQALASLDPSGKVDVCIDGEWKDNRRQSLIDIIKGLPFVEEMVNYPEINLEKKYNTWFWSRHTYPSPALEVFKCKDPQFDIGIAWVHSGLHESEFYMGLVRRFCGYTGDTPKQYAPIDETFSFKKSKKLIVLCNGSYGHLAPSKKWNKFPELAKTLRNWYDCEIAKIGYLDELKDVKDYDHDFVGNLNMLQTAMVIKQADLLITTDTCNMHIGDALNIPMVVLWGGSLLSKNRPINGHAAIVNKNYGCQSCHEPGGNGDIMKCVDYKCISTITVGEVMLEVRKIL